MPALFRRRPLAAIRAAAALSLAATLAPAHADTTGLIEPAHLSVDGSLPAAQRDAQILAARRYDTFWHNGDPALARAALADDFADRTPPPGRAPGLAGPLAASRTMRAAIPDLSCEIEQMIVAGTSPAGSGPCKAKARRSTSSRPTSIASSAAGSPRTGTSKTT
ncbi:snoaL-like polyketide cyclase family protein [Burkholderia pseudomallei BDU 2]|nr:snoaL-like polyketide cyclase family protein [Burkholderia pseudomallei BDU 2]